jgi:hypothetical protein
MVQKLSRPIRAPVYLIYSQKEKKGRYFKNLRCESTLDGIRNFEAKLSEDYLLDVVVPIFHFGGND